MVSDQWELMNIYKDYINGYVHVWSKGVHNVEDVVSRLRQNPKVIIVTPEVFMELVKNNVEP